MIRRLWKTLKLAFDRSFSGAGWKQITWLFSILGLVLIGSLWIKEHYAPDVHDMRTLELLLDPGSFVLQDGDPLGYERLPLLLLTFIGAIFFTGGLVSVVSNILVGRITRFRQGEIRYRFDGHIVLLGANDTAAGVIRELHAEPENSRRDIVLLTQNDVEQLRRTLHAYLTPAEERHLIILYGQRDSYEELDRIHIHRAHRVFLLGDNGEQERDSVSINALVQIARLLGTKHRSTPLPCHLSFEYQSSFQIFQLTDFDDEKRIKERIHLSATNFHENWAQRVLVSGSCDCDGKRFDYTPLDRDGIDAESGRHVHLIVVGMSRMGIAMGVTAAHTAHYPNFVTRGIRTRITFIDPDAEREMNYLKGRYEALFELSHYTLRKTDGKQEISHEHHAPQNDFLDVEWEFIEGGIETPYIRQSLDDWTKDPDTLTTLVISGNSAAENIAAALYLPQPIYARQIPIFVYQKEADSILDVARHANRYRSIRPFGMMSESYDAALKQRIRKAMRINYLYDRYFEELAAAAKENRPFDRERLLPDVWPEKELERRWNNLTLPFQWSNIFAANIIPTKLRSLGIEKGAPRPFTDKEVELIARTEHNRWNIERLLMGYRPATPQELERALSDAQYAKTLKTKEFAHINIAPYEQIPEETREIDRILTRFIQQVEQ